MTELVRPTETWAVTLMPIHKAAWDGPASVSEGIALFNSFASTSPYVVGSEQYDAALPVALITHRDGSASDYLPQGMKGAPKTRLFGPGPTAGAFSTFIQFVYWGEVSFQFASGDTITKDGAALIGHGVVPDEIVEQKQSDLLAGKDSIHEAALAWVRQELKP
jgi:C-terminal processing protease CtpA/Prc